MYDAARALAAQDRGRRGARLLLRRVVAAGVHRARVRGVPDRPRSRRHRRDRQGARAGRRRLVDRRVPRGHALARTGTCSGSATAPRGWRSSSASGWCRSRSSAPTRRCRRAGGGRASGRPVVTLRYGDPLYPEEGETHQALSVRMQQAVMALFDEERTDWFQATCARRARRDAVARRARRRAVAPHVGGLAPGAAPRASPHLGVADAADGRRAAQDHDRRGGDPPVRHRGLRRARRSTRSRRRSGCASRRSCTTSRTRTRCWRRASPPRGNAWPRRSARRSRPRPTPRSGPRR